MKFRCKRLGEIGIECEPRQIAIDAGIDRPDRLARRLGIEVQRAVEPDRAFAASTSPLVRACTPL